MNHNQSRSIEEIAADFERILKSLVTKFEKRLTTQQELANFNRAKKRMSLLKNTIGSAALIETSSPYFIEHAEHILQPDERLRERFIIDININNELKKYGVGNDNFSLSLAENMRAYYLHASADEKLVVYNEIRSLLTYCLEYKLHSAAI